MNLSDGFGKEEVAEAKRLFLEDRFVAIERIFGRTTPDDELRYDLAYLLWKTLRNRRAGNTNLNKTRDVLDRLQHKAAALASELAHMPHTLAADDAALFLNLADDQWMPLEIERVAELVSRLEASATKALDMSGHAKRDGCPVDTERHALVAYLIGIERKYTGRSSRYTFDPVKESYKGTFFQLLKTFEEAVAAVLNEAPPSDTTIKGLLDRVSPSRNQVTKPKPKKHSSVT
jgi:hypothetical protein